jgi:hypothetical protein
MSLKKLIFSTKTIFLPPKIQALFGSGIKSSNILGNLFNNNCTSQPKVAKFLFWQGKIVFLSA